MNSSQKPLKNISQNALIIGLGFILLTLLGSSVFATPVTKPTKVKTHKDNKLIQ